MPLTGRRTHHFDARRLLTFEAMELAAGDGLIEFAHGTECDPAPTALTTGSDNQMTASSFKRLGPVIR